MDLSEPNAKSKFFLEGGQNSRILPMRTPLFLCILLSHLLNSYLMYVVDSKHCELRIY